MKQAGTFWLPDEDTYFVPFLADGAAGFQLDRLEAALERVTDWRLAVDIGAHVGTWTCRLAERFEWIEAFEPCPDARECLAKNIAGLGGGYVKVQPFALGAAEGHGVMLRDAKREGNTGSRFVSLNGALAADTVARIEVRTLDSFDLPAVGFLKIDVEGYEDRVIEGARETIRRSHPVMLVEEKPFPGRYSADGRSHAAALLAELGAREVARFRHDHVYDFR
jgi:FkbM family methyltransferase